MILEELTMKLMQLKQEQAIGSSFQKRFDDEEV